MKYQSKKEQRLEIKDRLAKADKAYLASSSDIICDKLFELIEDNGYENILSYKATSKEVNLDKLNDKLIANGIKVGYPICVNDNIEFYYASKFNVGAYGILEPEVESSEKVDLGYVDLVLVPLVGFDEAANRIGHGKGYYDRFLSEEEFTTIGVAFEIQKLDKVICDENDVNLDLIISEENIY